MFLLYKHIYEPVDATGVPQPSLNEDIPLKKKYKIFRQIFRQN